MTARDKEELAAYIVRMFEQWFAYHAPTKEDIAFFRDLVAEARS